MAKVRNISGEELFVPELNKLVSVDEVVEVPDARLVGYVGHKGDPSPVWADETPAPSKKKEN